MLLARNVAPVVHHKNVPATEASGPFKKPITDEGPSLNRTQSPAFLSLPGALPVSSQVGSPSQGKPTCNLDLATVKSSGPLKPTVVTQQKPPKVIHSLGSPAAPLFSTGMRIAHFISSIDENAKFNSHPLTGLSRFS